MSEVSPESGPETDPQTDPQSDPQSNPQPQSSPEPDSGGNVVWPDQWRDQMAGENDPEGKRKARLARFDSPDRIFDSYLELEEKFKSADIPTPFPADGDEAAQQAWREKNNIPADPKGYFEGVPDGIVVGEADQAGMEVLAEAMHGLNAPPEFVHAAMGAYYKVLEDTLAERAEDDKNFKRDMEEQLREHYGNDFRRNITDLDAWVSSAPGEVRNKLLASRMPDGKPLGSDPDVIKWMVGQMREINPHVIVPGLGEGDPAQAIDDEISSIEERIRTDNAGYRRDKKMQSRYLELIAARDKQTVKA